MNAIFLRLGAKLTDSEIDLLWKDFEAETIPFSHLVRRFFKPDEFSRLRNIKFKIKLGSKLNFFADKLGNPLKK